MRLAVSLLLAVMVHAGLLLAFAPKQVVPLIAGTAVEVELGSASTSNAGSSGSDATARRSDGASSPGDVPVPQPSEPDPVDPVPPAPTPPANKPPAQPAAPAPSDPQPEPAPQPEPVPLPAAERPPQVEPKPEPLPDPRPKPAAHAVPNPPPEAESFVEPGTKDTGATPETDAPPGQNSPNQTGPSALPDSENGPDGSNAGTPTSRQSAQLSAPSTPQGNAERANYAGLVMQHLSRIRRPRAEARGSAFIQFRLDATGMLEEAVVVRSSGSARFDRQAIRLIERAAPFPAPPQGAGTEFTVEIEGG